MGSSSETRWISERVAHGGGGGEAGEGAAAGDPQSACRYEGLAEPSVDGLNSSQHQSRPPPEAADEPMAAAEGRVAAERRSGERRKAMGAGAGAAVDESGSGI